MTLGLSMGAQPELEKMREETGVDTVHSEEQAAQPTMLSVAAEAVGRKWKIEIMIRLPQSKHFLEPYDLLGPRAWWGVNGECPVLGICWRSVFLGRSRRLEWNVRPVA